MNIHLLIIDPQKDFCDDPNGKNPGTGALFVPGAEKDMENLSIMINKYGDKIDDIHCTLDSHHPLHIAHPIFWKNATGQHPNPFTIITYEDVLNGVWMATSPKFQSWAIFYTKSLKDNHRYDLCIWPPHCLIGTNGAAVTDYVSKSLRNWAEKYFAMINYWTKGSNIKTEHYSATKADVLDPNDDINTGLNTKLIEALIVADKILLAGEALDYCVANTTTDIANAFGDDSYVKKLVLLEDCTSAIQGQDDKLNKFLTDMKSRGMEVAKSTDFFA